MGTARLKQEEEAGTKIVVRNLAEGNVGTKEKSPKLDLTNAKDLTIELPEGCESSYHRLN